MWNYVIMLVVSVAVSFLARPKTTSPKPAAIDDFDMPVANEGTEQEVIFGDCWTGNWMVLSYGNLRTSKVTTKSGK